MWNRLRGSLLVIGLLVSLYFITVLIHQKALLDATSILNLKTSMVWSSDYSKMSPELHKLLILAYPRSGSSFTGDILSASPNSSFIFEPLYHFEPFGHPIDVWSHWNSSVRNHVRDYMEALFECDNKTVFHHTHNLFPGKHKRENYCNESNPRVIKTIRLHKINLDPWILDSDKSHPLSQRSQSSLCLYGTKTKNMERISRTCWWNVWENVEWYSAWQQASIK